MNLQAHLGLFSFFAALITVSAGSTPASAACVLVGGTVTCTGRDDDGFIGGNNLTVTVETGASVDSIYDGNPDTLCPEFRSALRLGQNARVTNRGQMLGRGTCGLGIEALIGLTLSNEGTIITDAEVGFAVLAGDGFNVTNSGTLRTVSAGSTAFVGASRGRFINSATGVIETTGADSPGIFVENTNTITNDGRILTVNAGSFGIDVGAGNLVTNNGTITTTGIASAGVRLRGSGNSVVNRGTITALPALTPRDGEESVGIAVENGGGTVVNSGTIRGDYAGVYFSLAQGTVRNDGTISARTPTTSSRPGAAILFGQGGVSGIERKIEITNSGTIQGNGVAAIRPLFTNALFDLIITNSGRIDGDIILGRSFNEVTLKTGSIINGVIDGSQAVGSNLTLDGSGTFSNVLLGNFTIFKVGAGTWTLARDYQFFYPIEVIEGTLEIAANRRFTGGITVSPTATLAGSDYTFGELSGPRPLQNELENYGTLSPGLNGPAGAAITIVGAFLQGATGQTVLDVNGTTSDRILVNGTASFLGTLNLRYAGAPVKDGQDIILFDAPTGGTLRTSGAFTQVTDNSPYFINSTIIMSANRVTLRTTRRPFASVAQLPEEFALAAFFDRAVASGTNPSGVVTLLDQQTASEARATFSNLTSDQPAASQTWGLMAGTSLASAISPWLEVAPSDSPRGQWRTWGSVFARTGEGGSKTDSANFDYDMQGVIAAGDYAVSDGTRIGVAASRITGETFFAAGAAKTSLSTNSLSLYLSQAWPNWRAGAGITTSDGQLNAKRTQTLGTQISNFMSRADTGGESAFIQTSYAMGTEMWLLKPTASLTYVRAKIGSLDERATTGLAVRQETASSLRGDVGVRAIAKPGPVHFSAAVFWSQNLKDNDRTAQARLSGLPGSDFIIVGMAEKRGWLNTQAGVNIEIMPGLMARMGWSGILNDRLGGHTANAGLSYRW